MTRVFADSGYWIALLSPRDALHEKARQASASLGRTRIITSEGVLTEVLNAFASKGDLLRMTIAIFSRPGSRPYCSTELSRSFRRPPSRRGLRCLRLRHLPRVGHFADHRPCVRAEDFADLEDRRQTGDVSAGLDHAEILMMHPRTPGQLHDRPATSDPLASKNRSEADGIRIRLS